MAFTLEATIVIPVTMAITVGIISASINLYDKIESESKIEKVSLLYPVENDELWSCKVNNWSYNNGQIEKSSNKKIENTAKPKEYYDIKKDNTSKSSGYESSQRSWSKMISTNPVKEKIVLDLLIDSIETINQYLPVLKEMESLFLKES